MNTRGALVEKAFLFALRAHGGQMRKEASTPYIVHPARVAILLARYGFSDTVVAAGLVHDVVEDTDVSIEEVERELGEEVKSIVAGVTEDGRLPWEQKKKAYIEAVRVASPEVKAVSAADKIASAESLLAAAKVQGTDIWKHFNAGKEKKLWFEEAMLTMLQESWPHSLVDEYARLVEELKKLD